MYDTCENGREWNVHTWQEFAETPLEGEPSRSFTSLSSISFLSPSLLSSTYSVFFSVTVLRTTCEE